MKLVLSFEIVESFIYCWWTYWLKVQISQISQMLLQFNKYKSNAIYRSWQHITNPVSLYRYVASVSLYFCKLSFSMHYCNFFEQYVSDISTFLSFLKFCSCFGETPTSNLTWSSFLHNALMTCHTNIHLPIMLLQPHSQF